MSDFSKTRICVSPLSKEIVIARFGKDPSVALERRDANNEFWRALCDFAFDHKMPEVDQGVRINIGGGDEKFEVTIRRIKPEGDGA